MSDTEDLEAKLQEAIRLHRQGMLTKAEWGYLEILESDPDHPGARHLLGVIAHQMGDPKTAAEHVRKSLEIDPQQLQAWNNLGNIQAASGQTDDAIESYSRAIELKPDYAQAHHNLANVLADRGEAGRAMDSYRKAIELDPSDAASYQSLAAIFEKMGRFEDALAAYRDALSREPESAAIHNRLGSVLRKLGRLEEARQVYDGWLRLEPDHPAALHLRAACVPDSAPPRAADDYVKNTFDGFADEFDECLAGLGYQVPRLIADAVRRHVVGSSPLDIADLGCGTGLCAPHLRSRAKRLVGVDLSAGMLAKARELDAYNELVESELTQFLVRCGQDFDLLVAADTFIYLGELQPVFRAAHNALRDRGYLVFSCEQLPDGRAAEDYRINAFGRYTHSVSGLETGLSEAGFAVTDITEAVLRNEGDQPVGGVVVAAQKTGR